jgi:hypothetical protein
MAQSGHDVRQFLKLPIVVNFARRKAAAIDRHPGGPKS